LEDVEASKDANRGYDTAWETWIPEKSFGNSDFEDMSSHPLFTVTTTLPV